MTAEPLVPGGTRRWWRWQFSFFALAAVWGCSFWWIKVSLRAVSFVDVALLRLTFGAVALVAVSAATGTVPPLRSRTWAHLFVLAMLFCSIPFTLFSYGETHISAVLAGLINALTPLTTVAASIIVFRSQRPHPRVVAGLALGLVGVLVVLGVWNGLGDGQLVGSLACVGAVTCYGLGFPYSARFITGRAGAEPPLALATGQVVCGAAQLVVPALVFGRFRAHPPATSFLALAALGALGTGIAYMMNFDVIGNAPPAVASTVTYIVPIYAVIVGAAFLGEAVHWYEPVGAALILLGAAGSHGRLRRRTPAAPAAPPLRDHSRIRPAGGAGPGRR